MKKALFALLAFLFIAPAWAQFADQRQYAASTGGSANAQTVAVPNYALDIGVAINFRASFTNNAATTLNVNGQGAVAVKKQTATGLAALTGGEIVSGQIAQVFFDGAQFELINSANVGFIWVGTSGGSANAQTVTAATAFAGQALTFRAGFTNTGALTLNGVAVDKDTIAGPVALVGGEVFVGNVVSVTYDSTLTVYHLLNPPVTKQAFVTLASATTTDLGTANSPNVNVSGVTTITSFGSSASVNAPLYYVTFSGALLLTNNNTSLILPGASNITTAANDSLIAKYLGSGNWQVLEYNYASSVPVTFTQPTGRLTLTTATPVLSGAVNAATTIYYTPYIGNSVPLWNGTAFSNTPFVEISQLLSDATKSPAAAVAASAYDLFVWYDAGTVRLSRGPVWTNVTTRSAGTAIARVSGVLVNSIAITNGPGAGYGTYVGTIATDAGGATVTFNPTPAAASGGPTNGAWVGLWNQYNHRVVTAYAQDSKASWTYATTAWRSSDNSANNRVTFVAGGLEDYTVTEFTQYILNSGIATGYIGVGVNSTSAPSFVAAAGGNSANDATVGQPAARANVAPALGVTFVQALEYGNPANYTLNGAVGGGVGQTHQISAQVAY